MDLGDEDKGKKNKYFYLDFGQSRVQGMPLFIPVLKQKFLLVHNRLWMLELIKIVLRDNEMQ